MFSTSSCISFLISSSVISGVVVVFADEFAFPFIDIDEIFEAITEFPLSLRLNVCDMLFRFDLLIRFEKKETDRCGAVASECDEYDGDPCVGEEFSENESFCVLVGDLLTCPMGTEMNRRHSGWL